MSVETIVRIARLCSMTRLTILLIPVAAAVALAQPLSFEAASIKPSSQATRDMPPKYGPASISIPRIQLKYLIAMAYDIKPDQISGLARWMDEDEFEVVANAAAPFTSAQRNEMMQALLAERFQLKFHRQQKTIPAYVLVVAKDGPKLPLLKDAKPGMARDGDTVIFRGEVKILTNIIAAYLGPRSFPAGNGQSSPAPTEELPVFDQTNLAGEYEMKLDMSRTNDWFELMPQLGLKLEKRKLDVEVIVIDSASKPSQN